MLSNGENVKPSIVAPSINVIIRPFRLPKHRSGHTYQQGSKHSNTRQNVSLNRRCNEQSRFKHHHSSAFNNKKTYSSVERDELNYNNHRYITMVIMITKLIIGGIEICTSKFNKFNILQE